MSAGTNYARDVGVRESPQACSGLATDACGSECTFYKSTLWVMIALRTSQNWDDRQPAVSATERKWERKKVTMQ